MSTPRIDLELLQRIDGTFPGLIGVVITDLARGSTQGKLPVRADLLAPNGFLHAGSVTGFADTLCGFGCMTSLPEGAMGFTTIELKVNFLGTARDGVINGIARMTHEGRTTQVWDAEVSDSSGKRIAAFRCTQLILYPRE